jgi:hypothetical protein
MEAVMRTGNGARSRAVGFAWAVCAAVGVVGVFGGGPACSADEPAATASEAEEAAARVTELEKAVQVHKADKDAVALRKDLDDLVAEHKKAADPKLRARVNALLGTVLKATDDESFERDALKAIGDLGDPDNWRHVRSYCQQSDPKVAPALINEGLECAGKLKNDDAVPHLLRIVEKSKVFPVAASAMRALGNFGASKRQRTRILSELVTTVRKNVPGGRGMSKYDPTSGESVGGKNPGEETRWGTLSPAMVAALNQLTGQNVSTPQDWFDLYDRYKKNLGDLFSG